ARYIEPYAGCSCGRAKPVAPACRGRRWPGRILVDIGRKNPPHSPYYVSNIRELGMNPSKRFCEGQFSVFILPPNIRAFGHTEYSRRTYTIEWMNEEEGRFWVQLQ